MRVTPHTASIFLLLIIIALLSSKVRTLQPTGPVLASPNTESSPSNFIFSFNLINDLSTSSYLMIVFPFYPSSITPQSCNILNTLSLTTTSCYNLNVASGLTPNPLTINASAVNNINPNIVSTVTIVMGFSSTLTAGTSYSVQVRLQDNLPAVGALSQSFEMYTISGTGVMLQENWNMGQVYLELKNNNLINSVSINTQIGNLPGSTVSTFLIDVTIAVACPTPLSVFLFTISGNYQFTVSSLVTSMAVSGTPPQILSTTVVSPNIIRVTFNEQFIVSRHFRLTISNIFNPQEISQGAVSLYSLPYNSISPLEVSELSIPFQTVYYSPTLNIYTAQGNSPTSPMLFYMSTNQYLTLTILLPRLLDPSFILQIKSDVLVFQKGTVYARTSTVNNNNLIYKHPGASTIQISGFSTIPSGTLITVTMRAWFGTSPIFNMYVSIDTPSHIDSNAPIIYNTVSATVSAIPTAYISAFTGSGNQPNKLTVVQGGTSSILFTVTPLFTTYTGSFLQIYTSKYLSASASFNASTSCLVSAVAQPCTIVTNTQYTVITIASSTSYNLFPISTAVPITINQLSFTSASSHSMYLYHFYFQLTVSLASLAATNLYLISPMVVQQRNTITNFQPYFSNNIYNTGSNYLNVIRLVSSDPTQWQNVIQVNQKRIISIFAFQGWTNLFTLSSYSSYPCVSNLAVTCTFIQGSNDVNNTSDFPLNWDRINIVLPGNQSSTKFSIVLPTQYVITTALSFQIWIGYVDTNNGAITYLQTGQNPLLGGANTALTPVSFAPTSNAQMPNKPKQAAMQLNIAGLAGSYASNVSFTVVPSNLFQATSYSACLIVMSSWKFLDSLTTLSSTSLSSSNPQFANVEQTPVSLQISSSNFLTYIPFKTTAGYSTAFNIIFNNIKLPYNLDLPYYSVTLVDYQGNVDGYNEFINQNQNIFYTGVLNSLSFTCNDNSLGVTNTYCTVAFSTFQDIEVSSILLVNFYGLFVSTNLCSMIYTYSNVTIPISSCAPNTNLNVLTVTLGNSARLPAATSYSLLINGISIDSSQISNYITFQFMDPTGSYAIEQKTSILTTSVSQNFPIYITQVFFAYNNPVVTSSLFLNFTLPRSLNNDQAFALVLSKDFITLNNIPSKIYIRLMQADGITQIPATWVMKFINSQIIFQGLQAILGPNAYSLELYGIQTPSTVTQDMISVIFLRIYGNTYTKSNTASSTAVFPSLSSKVSSLITLQTFFNTEGLEQQLQFTIVNQYETITQNTIWIVNLPIYYSKIVWNDNNLIYCTISGTPLSCGLSQYTPYQIVLYSSPLIIQASSSTYTINIYGIPCPRATYLNGNNMFITQSIFFGMATSADAASYADYSQLFVSSAIINPQSNSSYGSIVLKDVTSSNMQVYQSTFLTITMTCSVAIPSGSWIFITFPSQFDNFNNIPVIVQTQYTVTNYQVSSNSTVVNTRVGFKLNTLTIPANTLFQVMITSLLTPKQAVTIDMNKLRVMVATSDRSSTIATSLQSRNQLGSLAFVPNSLHLVVNNYSPIQITAGTYSTPISIKPSDNSTFLTNMMIKFSSLQLVENPNPVYLYLGNSFASFIVGAGQNLIPTSYTFNIVKQETSISAYYSTLSEYSVIVNSIPITITFPTSFTVPLGGCSMPVVISLTNPPYSFININYQYNTTVAPPNKFWVSQEISYEQPQFTLNNTQRWVSFCSSPSFSVMSFNVNLNLGGDNAASYNFSTSYTTINIVSAAVAASPTFSLVASNVQKTFAAIQITTNVVGFFFYQLMISPLVSPLSLSGIQTYVKGNNMTLQSNNDYITNQIYIGDRDHRVGYTSAIIAGSNFLSITDLLPERSYTLCGYLQNQYLQISTPKCVSFTMQSWGVISKAYISFNSPILANALNNVLCFFVKASNSQINQILDLEGNSCSLNTSPQNYFYKYKGNTTTSQSMSTIIYHTANVNLTTDASISAFNSLFDSNGITASSLSLAQTQFSINFVNVSTFIGNFQPMDAMTSSSASFQPQISLSINDYTPSSYQIVVSGITSNVHSSVYFILVSYKNITTNQISSKTTISVKPLIVPTSNQIASCIDGAGFTALQCMRVVIQAGSSYSFKFNNIVQNSVYAIYYTYANEYPQRPVFYGSVKSRQVYTVSSESTIKFCIVVLTLMLLLIL